MSLPSIIVGKHMITLFGGLNASHEDFTWKRCFFDKTYWAEPNAHIAELFWLVDSIIQTLTNRLQSWPFGGVYSLLFSPPDDSVVRSCSGFQPSANIRPRAIEGVIKHGNTGIRSHEVASTSLRNAQGM